MSWHRHVCREAGAISWLISAFRITIFSAAPCHFGCFLPRSPSFCAFAALMCRTWGFYRVLNIAPQGSHNQDSISNYAMESREREREREMQGCEARWHWTISALNPFVFHFPYLQKKKKNPKANRTTNTNTPTCGKQGALCPSDLMVFIVSASKTLQIFIRWPCGFDFRGCRAERYRRLHNIWAHF